MSSISFIIAVNNYHIFNNTFKTSAIFRNHDHEIIIREGYSNSGEAFNSGIELASNDILVIAHQDIYFSDGWDKKLVELIRKIEVVDKKWGVLGSFGIDLNNEPIGYVYSNGLQQVLGFSNQTPTPAQSLDEIVLVLNKKNQLNFDPHLPSYHMYGTDICLEASKRGYSNYIISNFCIHNSLPVKKFPPEFWTCVNYMRNKWSSHLPVISPCIRLEKFYYKHFISRIKNAGFNFTKSEINHSNNRLTTQQLLDLQNVFTTNL